MARERYEIFHLVDDKGVTGSHLSNKFYTLMTGFECRLWRESGREQVRMLNSVCDKSSIADA